ncbi:hypothetical protein ACFE04_007229 [Oxalis oulophora]
MRRLKENATASRWSGIVVDVGLKCIPTVELAYLLGLRYKGEVLCKVELKSDSEMGCPSYSARTISVNRKSGEKNYVSLDWLTLGAEPYRGMQYFEESLTLLDNGRAVHEHPIPITLDDLAIRNGGAVRLRTVMGRNIDLSVGFDVNTEVFTSFYIHGLETDCPRAVFHWHLLRGFGWKGGSLDDEKIGQLYLGFHTMGNCCGESSWKRFMKGVPQNLSL